MSEDPKRLRWAVNGARQLRIPADAVEILLAEVDRAMLAGHFRPAKHDETTGALRVYQRGSYLGDVLIGGSGLAAITNRIGPLSSRGVAVVWVGPDEQQSVRVIISLVAGTDVGADFVDAVERALAAVVARGVPVTDAGWNRAVDVDRSLPAHPHRARELGLV